MENSESASRITETNESDSMNTILVGGGTPHPMTLGRFAFRLSDIARVS